MKKKCVIIGGGTVHHYANHMAVAAMAYGSTARKIAELCKAESDKLDVELHLTKMAGGTELETVDHIETLIARIIADRSVKIVFFNCAIADYEPMGATSKYNRMDTRQTPQFEMRLSAGKKLINRIREHRKDIFLVGFKTTSGSTPQEQYTKALRLCKEASCNLVLANDLMTGKRMDGRRYMIVTPEEAAYHESPDRDPTLAELVKMAYLRSHLTFTRSTVVSGDPISWDSDLVPSSLRKVVNHCIDRGAYKAFNGKTAGHFAVKLSDTEFLTSRRKTNFNDLKNIGLVHIKTDGPDSVLAYGSKPSVGGQSQRIVFSDHPGMDCIVHFHCQLKDGSKVPVASQREFECGSHECGKNTSNNLAEFALFGNEGSVRSVFLDKHGPNVVFSRDINPDAVIDFIERNFDLTQKTGGYQI